jgi:hypothetical protein
MNMLTLSASLLPRIALTLGCVLAAHADDTTQTIKFSDPSRPGTIKISLGRGELRVQGAETNEVSIKSDADVTSSKPRKDGMRVLSAASSFALSESDNVITLDSGKDWGGGGNASFQLTVPRSTTIIVQNAWGGGVTCAGIDGDIEINSMQGELRLEDVAGGVVAGTMNGRIQASFRELHEGKPLSFTSMNGEVIVRVPESAKANVRLRTQNGSVLTDFPENALTTKTEASAGFSRTKSAFPGNGKVLTAEIQDAIREATQLSATAVKEALEAIKEGLDAARLDSDNAHQQMDEARKEMDRARRDLDRARRESERRTSVRVDRPMAPAPAAEPVKPATPQPPRAPAMLKPKSFPAITGGKLVTGTLNGGGPEISISTMNGDVILRKLDRK